MVANYAITAWLAAGGLDRARRNPLLLIAMGIKLVWDGVTNVELAGQEWRQNKAFCEYSQVATVCSIASIVLAVPEVVTAVDTLLGRRNQDTKAQGNTR